MANAWSCFCLIRTSPPAPNGYRHLKKWMASDPRYQGVEIHEIKLTPIRHHEQEHRWYYLFQLRPLDGGHRKAMYAAVLLNGKVVPAIAEPSSIK